MAGGGREAREVGRSEERGIAVPAAVHEPEPRFNFPYGRFGPTYGMSMSRATSAPEVNMPGAVSLARNVTAFEAVPLLVTTLLPQSGNSFVAS